MLYKKLGQLTILTTVIIILGNTVFAQIKPQPKGVDEQLEQLKTELNLMEEQIPKVKAVIQSQYDHMQALRNKYSTRDRSTMQNMMEEMKRIRKETENHMKDILNEEQFKKFQDFSKRQQTTERRGKKDREGMRGRGEWGGMGDGRSGF